MLSNFWKKTSSTKKTGFYGFEATDSNDPTQISLFNLTEEIVHNSDQEKFEFTKEELEEFARANNTEIARLQKRVKHSEELIHHLRLTYMKELRSLRQLIELKQKNKDSFEYLEIRFFSPLDGLDENTVELLNEKLKDLKSKFDDYIKNMKDHYELLEKQVRAYDKIDPNILASTNHNSADSLIMKMTFVESRPREIWNLLEKHYGKDFFKKIAQFQYGMSQNDMNLLFEEQQQQLEAYKTKTLAKMARVWEESEQEIARLRAALDDKNQKHAQLEAKYIRDIKTAKFDAKEQIDIQYKELYNAKFHLFDIEKQEMYDQMKELK